MHMDSYKQTASVENETTMFFCETQRFRQIWLWLIIGFITILLSLILYVQIYLGISVGNHPAPNGLIWILWALAAVGTPVCCSITKMVTEVKTDRIIIRFFPFVTREYLFTDIVAYRVKEYNPLSYGRYGTWWNGAMIISGNRGIELKFKNGEKMLLGSQRAEELEQVIKAAMN